MVKHVHKIYEKKLKKNVKAVLAGVRFVYVVVKG